MRIFTLADSRFSPKKAGSQIPVRLRTVSRQSGYSSGYSGSPVGALRGLVLDAGGGVGSLRARAHGVCQLRDLRGDVDHEDPARRPPRGTRHVALERVRA